MAEPATSTDVFNSIIDMYSTTETFCLLSKSMSYCCPSQTPSAIVLKTSKIRGNSAGGACASSR